MGGRRRALIIATDTYDDPELSRLTAPERDAEELAGVLRDPELGDFEVETALNSASYEIAQRVETLLADAEPDDLVLIHFSGHGIKNKDGELVLAATNTHPRNLFSTGIKAADIQTLIFRSRSRRKILILDCCYGGAFSRGLLPRAAGSVDVGDAFLGSGDRARGCAVITASTAMEFAFEDSSLARADARNPSIFTGALVGGLQTGEADRDQDGRVSLSELYDYVYDRVRERSPNQTPSITQYEIQGELVIANNPHRLVTPGELPTALSEKIASDDKYVRLGAISVLREYAAGSNLPVAAAARLALARLVNDDSRKVAEDAGAALDVTRLRAAPATLDLGEVGQGSRSPDGRIRVEGPPLADSVLVTPSGTGIRVRRTGRDLHVQVDTANEGPIDGVIDLSGPAGTATVVVRAMITAPNAGFAEVAVAAGPAGAAAPDTAQPPEMDVAAAAAPDTAAQPPDANPPTTPDEAAPSTEMVPQEPFWTRPQAPPPVGPAPAVTAADPQETAAAFQPEERLETNQADAGAASLAIPAVGRDRTTPESARVWVRGIGGCLIAASLIALSGEWLPIVEYANAIPAPVLAAIVASVIAVGLRLLEALVPAMRVPNGAVVGVAGHSFWRGAAIQGLLVGVLFGFLQSATGASELASFVIVPGSFTISFALVEAAASLLLRL